METHASGFKLAEIDLELRGPGVIYGKEQSGFGDLRLDWVSDIFLLEEARESAKKTLRLYPDLSVLPLLESKMSEKFGTTHLE
jgi:ATP-dependent DNA helicase RecG